MTPSIHGVGEGLESALDFESTGGRQTAAKALHLMARGAHVSGFVLRPDDGLSDVAIVCNGATRWLTPAEFQWLMHESVGRSILTDGADELERLRAEMEQLRLRAEEVVWSWRMATGHEDLPHCPEVRRAEVEGAMLCLEDAVAEATHPMRRGL